MVEKGGLFILIAALLVACSDDSKRSKHGDGDDDTNEAGDSGLGAGRGGSGGTTGTAGTNAAGSGGTAGSAGSSNAGSSNAGSSSGGTNATGGTSSGGGTAGEGAYLGQMFVWAPALQDVTGSFSARFSAPGRAVTTDCQITEYGDCTLEQCPTDGGVVPNGGVPHAGQLTFESSTINLVQHLDPGPDGVYETAALPAGRELFLGEEMTTFSAAGGEVPAFSADLEFPLLLLLDMPPTIQGGAAVSQTSDLTLAWSRGTDDIDFLFQVTAVDTLTSAYLLCQVPSLPGTLTVPGAALQRFPSSAPITLATLHHRTITAGDYSIDLWLGAEVRSPDKAYNIDLSF